MGPKGKYLENCFIEMHIFKGTVGNEKMAEKVVCFTSPVEQIRDEIR